jgi:NNP family nitrate/nitrite transporter-like MFS transporter
MDFQPATRIDLFSLRTVPMRTFHLTWLAFFLCFFAWFGMAPLMPVVREEFGLSKQQVGWCIIGSVAITVLARLIVGRMCDAYGPRRTYAALLVVGALPVMGIGLAADFTTFLLFRVLIGVIGASFVITQYHTSRMFAANCVGTANATVAGWGNLGGGVTQMVMPALFGLLVGTCQLSAAVSWRLCMVAAGGLCLLTAGAYLLWTQDTPAGNFADLRRRGLMPVRQLQGRFGDALRDHRVWSLALLYGCCFGMELTVDNVAALYFVDYFDLNLHTAGLAAGSFGLMNLFARALGGLTSDRWAYYWGFAGRTRLLFLVVLGEGLMLLIFSQMRLAPLAVATLLLTGLFIKMSNGAVYAVVPFINPQALGSVAGIVGAGGNVGAVLAGLLFQRTLPWPTAFWLLGLVITGCSIAALAVTARAPMPERAAERADALPQASLP